MKKPEEIKKGLECCFTKGKGCDYCPYVDEDGVICNNGELGKDAITFIEQLEKLLHESFERNAPALEAAYGLAGKVKQLEAKVPKWISVKERMPEEYKPVLVYAKHTPEYFSDWFAVMEDTWLGDSWECNGDSDVHEVTHWMPLPEPPEV